MGGDFREGPVIIDLKDSAVQAHKPELLQADKPAV